MDKPKFQPRYESAVILKPQVKIADKDIDEFFQIINEGRIDELMKIGKRVPFYVKNKDGNTLMHMILFKDNNKYSEKYKLSVFERLLNISKELPFDTANNSMQTPLHIACMFGYLKIAKLLVDNGANVNAVDYSGMSPLHYAIVGMKHNEILNKMTDDSDLFNKIIFANEPTPLIEFFDIVRNQTPEIKESKKELIEYLLTNGASTNIVDSFNHQPIYYVIKNGDLTPEHPLFEKSKQTLNMIKEIHENNRNLISNERILIDKYSNFTVPFYVPESEHIPKKDIIKEFNKLMVLLDGEFGLLLNTLSGKWTKENQEEFKKLYKENRDMPVPDKDTVQLKLSDELENIYDSIDDINKQRRETYEHVNKLESIGDAMYELYIMKLNNDNDKKSNQIENFNTIRDRLNELLRLYKRNEINIRSVPKSNNIVNIMYHIIAGMNEDYSFYNAALDEYFKRDESKLNNSDLIVILNNIESDLTQEKIELLSKLYNVTSTFITDYKSLPSVFSDEGNYAMKIVLDMIIFCMKTGMCYELYRKLIKSCIEYVYTNTVDKTRIQALVMPMINELKPMIQQDVPRNFVKMTLNIYESEIDESRNFKTFTDVFKAVSDKITENIGRLFPNQPNEELISKCTQLISEYSNTMSSMIKNMKSMVDTYFGYVELRGKYIQMLKEQQ